ncbi:hypothetical protein ONZ45_g16709 [Pleurotus djamor]|nr:hypothetical protein ONZ45_g16709 [Pleurotus djamor]
MDDDLAKQRRAYQKRIASAQTDEEDPLAVYQEYVQWILKNYPNDKANSGLVPVLEQVTRKFKEDLSYKTDLRYLKLWILYAKHIEKGTPAAVYGYLLKHEIGTSYSVLYEEFASTLEHDGRHTDADTIYRKGIKRQARPLEKLKAQYREFQARQPSTSSSKPANPTTSTSVKSRPPPPTQTQPSSTSSPSSASAYSLMLAPPIPGKRPEKLMFSLPLLFTQDGVEYCSQEVRARSMGLLGKKWGPPNPSELPRTRAISFQSSSSDEEGHTGNKASSHKYGGRRSLGLGLSVPEPTVTINTKEALADVFGMYNSPDRTITTKLNRPGTKYAPVKRVEMGETPAKAPPPLTARNTPASSFRPFVDENAVRKENATPAAKLQPFVDPADSKTPHFSAKPSFTTPRGVLAPKEHTTPSPTDRRENGENAFVGRQKMVKLAPVSEDAQAEDNASGRVFTPAAPSRTQALQERTPAPAFKPFIDDDARTPFKVFSRPPEDDGENAHRKETNFSSNKPSFAPFVDKPTFTPFTDRHEKPPAFTPFRDKTSAPEPPTVADLNQISEDEERQDIISSSSTDDDYDYEEAVQEDQPLPSPSTGTSSSDIYDPPDAEDEAPYAEGEYYEEEYSNAEDAYPQDPPLGGRFGNFNVMTPITERTFEFTSTRSVFSGTPSDRERSSNRQGYDAVEVAERLAAELKGDDHRSLGNILASENARGRLEAHESASSTQEIEERTGKISLVDTLTKTSNFKPPNPCNAFNSSVMSTLLSLVTSDSQFFDFTDQESGMLDGLQKFSKKTRKTSGSSSNGHLDVGMTFPVVLGQQRFEVSEKLGEGGFGAVFKARKSKGDDQEDEEDWDRLSCDEDDDDASSSVALKVVKPRNLWEYHVLRRIHSTLHESHRRSLVSPHALYAFRDESYLVLELCKQGNLLNVVNNAGSAGVSQQGACLDELLVMFFAIELLRLIEHMHRVGFIHGDLKIDNCLLRLDDVPGGASAWSSLYQPSGEGGWAHKGVKLIDFGRTIDTKLFPSNQEFIAEWPADERDCPEIREDRPWTYQTDYYGLAGIVYCMLFGKYMQSSVVGLAENQDSSQPGERYKVLTPLKRYWQSELWTRLFDLLLNPCLASSSGQLPICDHLAEVREDMEAWLQKNCNRTSGTLKGLLKKVELSALRGS